MLNIPKPKTNFFGFFFKFKMLISLNLNGFKSFKIQIFTNKNVKSEYDDMQRRFAFRETLAMRNGFRTFSAPSIPADAGAAKRISRATCLGGKFLKK